MAHLLLSQVTQVCYAVLYGSHVCITGMFGTHMREYTLFESVMVNSLAKKLMIGNLPLELVHDLQH